MLVILVHVFVYGCFTHPQLQYKVLQRLDIELLICINADFVCQHFIFRKTGATAECSRVKRIGEVGVCALV